MLLFISLLIVTACHPSCFNTSHVTLYLFVWCTAPYFLTVSIHLMLLFIRLVITFFFEMVCFNTSHVTLYQAAPMVKVIDCKFQYISCYSLSGYSFLMRKQFPVSIHLMLLFIAKQLPDGRFSDEFQYISYYSLSITIQNQFGFQYSFNTSHVTLYPSINLV